LRDTALDLLRASFPEIQSAVALRFAGALHNCEDSR
jgi:hypothetical protein